MEASKQTHEFKTEVQQGINLTVATNKTKAPSRGLLFYQGLVTGRRRVPTKGIV